MALRLCRHRLDGWIYLANREPYPFGAFAKTNANLLPRLRDAHHLTEFLLVFGKESLDRIPSANQQAMSGAVDVVRNPINRDRIAVVGWLWPLIKRLTVKGELAIRTNKPRSRPLLFE